MNVLLINGSPHANGNTAVALREMERIFQENQVKTEWIQVGNKDIRGCVACYGCTKKGACVFDDLVNETAPKFEACDGMVIGRSGLLCLCKCNSGCVFASVVL